MDSHPHSHGQHGKSQATHSAPSLTRRQQAVLDLLSQRAAEGLPAPTLMEVCEALGLRSRGSLHKHIQALVNAGLVAPTQGRRRGIHLIQPDHDSPESLPLLGRIAAGRPIEAVTDEITLNIPSELHGGRASYALEVRGDSMRDAGVLDGDWVLVEHKQQAKNGDMVVALIDGDEATLKFIQQSPEAVFLHPANPEYAVQRYTPEQVQIQGVVVAQFRRYR
ncbi:repressor LexA [Natronocella acetinitrilica]|uniref:LexA repressor n=1 Tax=Natronocella acetinitrilica TaxID=414046 RepID=A0AAE3KCV4_9GAMM|nr:transcriptional repressor LexA [Natronocella acetinitrilica]MCP1676129.1 repressor LexA [Natronocella acetinitrilica]